MTAIRKEIHDYIDDIPDNKLEALRPLLTLLIDYDMPIVETDLTGEEMAIVKKGREEYKNGGFIPLDNI